MAEAYTVEWLLEAAMALMGEGQKYRTDYTPFAPMLANTLMADCFDINNTLREEAGKAPLDDIPQVTDINAVVPYEYECLINIMAYGMAFWLLYQDGDNDKAGVQNTIYESNKTRFAKAGYAEITNIVG